MGKIKYELYSCSSEEHDHSVSKVTKETKNFVWKLLDSNITNSRKIESLIQCENLKKITRFQIQSLKQKYKKKLLQKD